MNSAINVALANRQMLALIVREIFGRIFPGIELRTLYDVSHKTCKEEFHRVGRNIRSLWVHRKRERPARWDPAMRHFRKPTALSGSLFSSGEAWGPAP